jgi:FtsP/CotA-like multicopper oxidase with cupredoxin domain
MFIPTGSSRAREREAQNARNNRAEIVRALNQGEVTRRELVKWGIFTSAGTLALINGLSPFAKSAYADVPTGAPRSPLFGVRKFTQRLPRLRYLQPVRMTRDAEGNALFPSEMQERPAKRLSYHTDFSLDPYNPAFRNPRTGRGPIEGRPPGEIFAHQRWEQYFPQIGYILSLAQIADGSRFHPNFPEQAINSVWTYGIGRHARGELPPFLIKGRYGYPIMMRIYNNLPVDRQENYGFGRNETQFHFHNAHNGAESDGAANVHHFPGTFYDYRWSTCLARADTINTQATESYASGPDDNTGLVYVPGDYRELQGSMWAHDHRFFFTAENVYKGNLGAINYYSGRDRGNEELEDGVNLRLPSGTKLGWGNIDFDVNLAIADRVFDQQGQLFFDIFGTDGFLGDVPTVNFAYAPFLEVLPRKYRFRILNASTARFLKLALADASGRAVPFQFIANDGNLVVNPIPLMTLGVQSMGERYDIVVDFSAFRIGDRIQLVNQVLHDDGRRLDEELSLRKALRGDKEDPMVGPIMEFRVVGRVESADEPGTFIDSTAPDKSRVPTTLTAQIPIVQPVRTRHVRFGRSGDGTSRSSDGECIPDCPEHASFPWSIRVNGEESHTLNANRISMLIPKPGEVEHWTYENNGGGWDHPIHLHFEEGVTISRDRLRLPVTERLVRKDVWRLGENGSVTFQVQFGEFGGAYVNHCHNTTHEDFGMLARIQLLTGVDGSPQAAVTPTPNPTPDGVFFTEPEILREGDPRRGGDSRTADLSSEPSLAGDDEEEGGSRRRRRRRRDS